MVLGMVTLMSVYGLVAQGQLHGDILPKYLRAWGFNFIMALPLQLIIVGPISRYFLQKKFKTTRMQKSLDNFI